MEEMGNALVTCLRAIAPAAAEHATEPTGEQTNRARSVAVDDDHEASSRSRLAARSRWLALAAAVIAASIAAVGWTSRGGAPAADMRPELEASRPAADTLCRSQPFSPAPATTSRAMPIEVASEPAASRSAAPATSVRAVRLTSSPDGARVYRGNRHLGVTPLTLTLAAEDPTQTLTVEAPGYRKQRVVVGADRDHVNVVLSSNRAVRPAPRAAPNVRGVAEW
jgi:hypothetical protein